MALQSSTKRLLAGLVPLAIAAVATAVLYGDLPAEIAIQWDASGTPQDYASKQFGVALLPVLGLVLLAVFALIPRIDPLGTNFEAFRPTYDAIAVGVVAFLAYVHVLLLVWNAGYQFPIIQGLVPAIAALYVGVGYLMERAERNWFVGIRTPWTLSSEAVWRRTHDRAGPLFKIAGVVALGGVVLPEYGVLFLAVPVAVVAAYLTLYSYLEYRRLDGSGPTGT